ncbi:hypothetical protein KIW84_076375 [Lathyrus oleraceus]|uniref:Uncharacterized protein n=1 Tax=Pisum sativum TaxID=3888 RepID=A0A9D5A108_PEA|nr:hypothetical protein KIW84_076375 [Pisum sativum]
MEKKFNFSLKIVEKNGFDSIQKKKVNEDDDKIKTNELVGDSENSKNRKISWRVPHKKKHSEKHPGFNLDYSPPKTHPPSHN